MLIYLDTNVYNDVDRGVITAVEVKAFRATCVQRGVRVRLSLPALEEFLGVWETDRAVAISRLRIARELAGFDGLLKPPADILEEAIRAYAAGDVAPSPLVPEPQRRFMAEVLQKISDGSTEYENPMSEILANVREMKRRQMTAAVGSRGRSLDELNTRYSRKELAALPFPDFFATGAVGWAEAFAERKGLAEACRERGLDGLLAVRPVRLGVGVVMSQIHSQISAQRQPEPGDGYDVWHAILASTADIFVTADQRLYGHVSRVPDVDGFRVIRSVAEWLADE